MSRYIFIGILILAGLNNEIFAQEDPMLLRGNPIAGKTKSQACVACHNADGNSTTPIWPKIAGLAQNYIIQQLVDFQKGEKGPRYDPTMYGIVQNLSAQDMADLAAFYATQAMDIGSVDPEKLALGQAIYRGGNLSTGVPACTACHNPNGAGNYLANFPRLGGQNTQYVVGELKKFRDKQRSNDANGIMRDIANKMSDKEIEAVASYVAGLH